MRVIAARFKSNIPKRVGKEMKRKIQRKLIWKASVPVSAAAAFARTKSILYSWPGILVCFSRGLPGFLTVLSLTQMNWVNMHQKEE